MKCVRPFRGLLSVVVLGAVIFGPWGGGGGWCAQRLVLGVHPYLAASDIHTRFTPLAEYLAEATGYDVELEIAQDYESHINAIGEGRLDIAFMGPASYVRLVEVYGRRPILAGLQVGGKTSFQGYIIVPVNSPLEGLRDLKGRRFAFGDPNSTMSHLVPSYMLRNAGVEEGDLAAHAFLGSHDNVALGVLTGAFDAGAVKEETFHKYKARGIRMLAITPEVSEHVFVASSKMPQPLLRTVSQALYDLSGSERGRRIMTTIKPDITGLVPVKDSDYDSLRAILGVGR